MRRSTWVLFWIFIIVLVLVPIVRMGDMRNDPALEPYLDLAAKIRHLYRCDSITIKETGPPDATRLAIRYVVGKNPTLPDGAKEMKAIADLTIMIYKRTEIMGVDVERKVPRAMGGCDETYDVQMASFEKKAKRTGRDGASMGPSPTSLRTDDRSGRASERGR